MAQQQVSGFLHYNSHNGLANQNVQCIAQDSTGFLWLGTTEGLVKYDGYDFVVFRSNATDTTTLSCNNITAILPLSATELLVGTYDCGLNLFHTQSNKVERIQSQNIASTQENKLRTLSLHQDNENRIWLGLNDGQLYQFDRKTKQIHLIKAKPLNGSASFAFCHGFSEHLNQPNQLWIATLSGLVLLNKTDYSYQLFRTSDHKPDVNPVFNRTRYPVQLNEQSIWMGSWGGGLAQFDLEKQTWRHFLIDSTPPLNGGKNIVMHVLPKSDHELWVATTDSGLGIFNTHTEQFQFVDVENNLKHTGTRLLKTKAQFLYSDNENTLWAGFETGLAVELKSTSLIEKFSIPIPKKTNLKNFNYPFYFLADSLRNGLWIAPFHGDGLYFYSNETRRYTLFEVNSEVLFPRGLVWNASGKILLLTADAFWQFDPAKAQFSAAACPDTIQIHTYGGYQLMRATNGKIYIGTVRKGVFEWDESNGTVKHYFASAQKETGLLENGPIYALCLDTLGSLWVGSKDGATVVHPGGKKFSYFSYKKGLNHKAFKDVYSIVSASDGTVWMQSVSSGLLVVDPLNKYMQTKGFETGDGLLTNSVYQIGSGPNNLLLIYTSQGLQYINPLTRQSHYFSAETDFPGLPSEWDALQYLQGNTYTSTLNGYYRIPEIAFQFPGKVKTPRISRISVFEKDYPLNQFASDNLQFSYRQNFIRIYFSNFSFTEAHKIRLNYLIKGLSTDTFHTDKGKNDISLTGLAPGNYELLVWASYPESDVCSEVKSIVVVVSPPWWLTWWFISILTLLTLFTLYLIYRYRLKQVRETGNLKRKLAEMENMALRAQMNPHFLFNSLNSVNFYIQNNEPAKASQHLKKFSKLVRIILNNSRNDTVSLEDELEALKLYLEFEEVRFDKHFSYSIEVNSGVRTSDIIIPPLLLQPYVENAIWHGVMQSENGGNVVIQIAGSEDQLQFTIEDDGIGRVKAMELKSKSALKQKSHGMDITNERVRLFNVTHSQSISTEILDLYDKTGNPIGTRVSITYKQNA
ncbi:MAG: hypothetical protein EP332_09030 [Bacteroidetes bacterium]|nr:MAG: hypothetical protein EP332_09030 [Bacteroidota bacterium]